MPYKIVETLEKGKMKLSVVPSPWEWKGHLKYPKKTSEYKFFSKKEDSKPRPEWPVMQCKVLRTVQTINDAEEELTSMLTDSDTDVCSEENTNTGRKDDNDMAEHLLFQPKDRPLVKSGADESAFFTFVDGGGTILTTNMQQADPEVVEKLDMILVNQNMIIAQQKSFAKQFMRPSDPNVEKKLDRLAERQNDMMEKLDKFAEHLVSLSAQVQDAVSKITTYKEYHVVSPAEASTFDITGFEIKPIDNLQDLEEFESFLSDLDKRQRLMKHYSILCSSSQGKGVSCAYKLLDVVFTRDVLCKCSWAGGSRGDAIKIALKGYKNILSFFFQMVFSWDKTYTMERNESFFKMVLKNSEKRKSNRNMRASTQKNRLNKQLKNQPRRLKNINVTETKKHFGEEIGINDHDHQMEYSNIEDEIQKKHKHNEDIKINRHEQTEINGIEENDKPVRVTKRIYPSIHGQAQNYMQMENENYNAENPVKRKRASE